MLCSKDYPEENVGRLKTRQAYQDMISSEIASACIFALASHRLVARPSQGSQLVQVETLQRYQLRRCRSLADLFRLAPFEFLDHALIASEQLASKPNR